MSIADLRFETTAFLGFFERQRNLYRRYWLWEVVWLVYAVVAVLSVGYLASGLGSMGALGSTARLADAQLYLLVGALLWQSSSRPRSPSSGNAGREPSSTPSWRRCGG